MCLVDDSWRMRRKKRTGGGGDGEVVGKAAGVAGGGGLVQRVHALGRAAEVEGEGLGLPVVDDHGDGLLCCVLVGEGGSS